MLSNAYFLAKFRFDTTENETATNLQNFANFSNFAKHLLLLRPLRLAPRPLLLPAHALLAARLALQRGLPLRGLLLLGLPLLPRLGENTTGKLNRWVILKSNFEVPGLVFSCIKPNFARKCSLESS